MRRAFFCMLSGLAVCMLLSITAFASKLNASDYPLRVHIFNDSGRSHYYYGYRYSSGSLSSVDGEGRANLYENGMPEAFDFSYRCHVQLMFSMGFETYMARWKKRGQTLELLLPEMGHPDKADLCELQVMMKDGVAYYKHNALMGSEPSAKLKEWMVKHQYDPEHGLNDPINLNQAGPSVNPGDPSMTPNQPMPPSQVPPQPQAPPPPQ
ncbi:MAG: hypothetical protein P4K94_08325 [Terracidiphilus sp.]|nr:hypothetical protein [Terracidiphilus sp.]